MTFGLIILVAIAIWVVVTFNRLVKLRNTEREAWSGIDVQLRKRHDLVPALVECVRGYSRHEDAVLTKVTEARADAARARSPESAAPVENALSDNLRQLFAVAEAYPDLKATENFQRLSAQLVAIEDDLQYARRYFNGAVRDLRNAIESFPSNLIAAGFGFKADEFFEVECSTERAAPKVDLDSPAH